MLRRYVLEGCVRGQAGVGVPCSNGPITRVNSSVPAFNETGCVTTIALVKGMIEAEIGNMSRDRGRLRGRLRVMDRGRGRGRGWLRVRVELERMHHERMCDRGTSK